MRKVSVYWSHICVLHRQEKLLLRQAAEALRNRGIEVEFHFFGIGYPQHMNEALREKDAEWPDIIVSADLEVFEDSRLRSRLEGELYPLRKRFPMREGLPWELLLKDEGLLPFCGIPLVLYGKGPDFDFEPSILQAEGLSFGGINNSAVKTIVKAVWSRYGKAAAEQLLRSSLVREMPIDAFRAAQKGEARCALVPSLYSLRADGEESRMCRLSEGALLIPSYVCARKTIPEETAYTVLDTIISSAFADFYAANGDLLVFPDVTGLHSRQEGGRIFVPDADWLASYEPKEFYELYCSCLPSAVCPE